MTETNKLTPGQVAELLGVTRQQVDKWLRAGRIKHTVLENGDRLIAKRDAKKPKQQKPGRKPFALTLLIALVLSAPAHANTFLLTHFHIPWTTSAPTDEFRWCIGGACLVQPLPAGVNTLDVVPTALIEQMTNGIPQTTYLTVGGVTYERPESFYVLPQTETATTDGTIVRWGRGTDLPVLTNDWHGLEIHYLDLGGINKQPGADGLTHWSLNVGINGTVPEPSSLWLIFVVGSCWTAKRIKRRV